MGARQARGIREPLTREALAIETRLVGPDRADPLRLALAFRSQGKLAEAEPLFRKSVDVRKRLLGDAHPDLWNPVNDLANLLLHLGKVDDAIPYYREMIKLAENDVSYQNQTAWKLVTYHGPGFDDPHEMTKLAQLAIEFATRAVELAPTNGNIWNTLGVSRYRAGEWQPAVEALAKSMDLRKGGDSSDWFFLAMVHWQLGDKDEARKVYDKAIEWMDKNQPKNEELLRFRAEAAELLGITQPKPQAEPKSIDNGPPTTQP